jgi:hypothetical protein
LQWGCTTGRVELWQTVERLIGDASVSPVLAHETEIVIERAIFIREKDNVVQALQRSR